MLWEARIYKKTYKQVTNCVHYITILACSLCYSYYSTATRNCRADTRISLKCRSECHEGWLHSFLTSVVDRGQRSGSHPGHFTSGDDAWELLVRGMCRPGSQALLPQPGIKLQFCGCTASGSVITLIGPARGEQKHKLYKQQVSIFGTQNVTLS